MLEEEEEEEEVLEKKEKVEMFVNHHTNFKAIFGNITHWILKH